MQSHEVDGRPDVQPQAVDGVPRLGDRRGKPAARVPLRENIANLGLFVMKQTMTIQAEPSPNKLTVLININREIAAGLRAGQSLNDSSRYETKKSPRKRAFSLRAPSPAISPLPWGRGRRRSAG